MTCQQCRHRRRIPSTLWWGLVHQAWGSCQHRVLRLALRRGTPRTRPVRRWIPLSWRGVAPMESTRSMQVARLPSCQVRPPSGPRLTDTDGFGDLPRPLRGSVSVAARMGRSVCASNPKARVTFTRCVFPPTVCVPSLSVAPHRARGWASLNASRVVVRRRCVPSNRFRSTAGLSSTRRGPRRRDSFLRCAVMVVTTTSL